MDTLLHAPFPGLVRQVQANGPSIGAVSVGMQKLAPRSSDADSLLTGRPIHEDKDIFPPACCPRTRLVQTHSCRVGDAVHQLEE